MRPTVLDSLLPVLDVFPESSGEVDGSDVDDNAVLDVVLTPEGVARIVGRIDNALNITQWSK